MLGIAATTSFKHRFPLLNSLQALYDLSEKSLALEATVILHEELGVDLPCEDHISYYSSTNHRIHH
jgi:hypothetical protein